jgi:hypothetical protein
MPTVWAVSAMDGLDVKVTNDNNMVPGFGSDTSPAGLASPLLGLDGSGDPVGRFDAGGNL